MLADARYVQLIIGPVASSLALFWQIARPAEHTNARPKENSYQTETGIKTNAVCLKQTKDDWPALFESVVRFSDVNTSGLTLMHCAEIVCQQISMEAIVRGPPG